MTDAMNTDYDWNCDPGFPNCAAYRAEISELRTRAEAAEAENARLRDALTVRTWTEAESDGMVRAFTKAREKHGIRETLFSVGAWLLRHRLATLTESKP